MHDQIPQELLYLRDAIAHGLADENISVTFRDAIPAGADLSMVWPRFALALLTDPESPVTKASTAWVSPAIAGVADLYREWVAGEKPALERWDEAVDAADEEAEGCADAAVVRTAMYAANTAIMTSAAADTVRCAVVEADCDPAADAWMWDALLRLLAEAPVPTPAKDPADA